MTPIIAPKPARGEALGRARQVVHRFASLSLIDPRSGSWDALVEGARSGLLTQAVSVLRNEPRARASRLARGERSIEELDVRSLLARLPDSPRALEEAYEQVFGLVASGACPPYETEYIGGKLTFQRSQALADVSGFYRAFGLRPSSRLPERHDHVALELEFMAFLIDLELRARRSSGHRRRQKVEVCRHAQARFLSEHLAWWTPAFAALLARSHPESFHGAVGCFLGALIPAERSLLSVTPPGREARAGTIERPEACEGCSLV